ncbi:MAG: relaxase/mobilization nuclease domain-containing protein [Lachnospiraceae bacterium]|nr:relaxase/mobilization nuclease domain-containing protein [Lachnospiraceae bacterium]
MATTSIWSIKGWLGKLVIYVENPEKTEQPKTADTGPELSGQGGDAQSLADVIAYAVDAEKTKQKESASDISDEKEELMQQYVSGVNCSPMTAREEMIAVKKRFGKDGGIIAFHGYQSFAPGECTPVMAHEIGVKLAEKLWGERFQVIVATHLDKAHHLHNHFVVNSVSFKDGLRYHRSKKDYQDMRNLSDKLCREYGLSVIEKPEKKAKHYGEWRAEQEGRPTYLGMIKADVDEAIGQARTEKQFFHFLKEKGYAIKIGKDVTLRAEGRERGMKLARNLGEDYTMEMIRKRILAKERKQAQDKKRTQMI